MLFRNRVFRYKFQGHLDPGGQTGFQTYPGHQFIWAEQNEVEPPVPLGQFTIKSDTMIYPFVDSTTTQDAIDTLEAELDFREDYFEENGCKDRGCPNNNKNRKHLTPNSNNNKTAITAPPKQQSSPPVVIGTYEHCLACRRLIRA